MILQDNEPHLRLYYFVLDTEEVLEQAIQAAPILFPQPLRGPLTQAYSEYRGEENYESPRHNLHYRLESGEVNYEGLVQVGLVDQQLNAKLTGYASARQALIQRGGLNSLRRTVRWMNSILGSLTSVLPPAEALKELKELVENGVKDVEELDARRH